MILAEKEKKTAEVKINEQVYFLFRDIYDETRRAWI